MAITSSAPTIQTSRGTIIIIPAQPLPPPKCPPTEVVVQQVPAQNPVALTIVGGVEFLIAALMIGVGLLKLADRVNK